VKPNWNEILEEQLFPGKKLQDSTFSFQGKFEEQFITTADHVKLHGILFKADKSKGLIFYLHGSNGAVDAWGKIPISILITDMIFLCWTTEVTEKVKVK
jgi:hypothetical protein